MSKKPRVVLILLMAMTLSACARLSTSASRAASSASPYEPPVHIPEVGVAFEVAPSSVRSTAISAEQAIAKAREEFGGYVAQAKDVFTEFGLFTDSQYGSSAGESGPVVPKYVNVPAWIVTFAGVEILPHGRPPRPGEPPLDRAQLVANKELNVIINGVTGEYMEAFTHR